MILELIPYDNGEWALIRTDEELIEVTCKDNNGERTYLTTRDTYIVFIGTLTQCQTLIDANNGSTT